MADPASQGALANTLRTLSRRHWGARRLGADRYSTARPSSIIKMRRASGDSRQNVGDGTKADDVQYDRQSDHAVVHQIKMILGMKHPMWVPFLSRAVAVSFGTGFVK